MNAVLSEPRLAMRRVLLPEVVEINPKTDRSKLADDTPVSFVPMAAVGAANGHIDVSTVRPYHEVKKGYTHFRDGDVLFAKVTPCMENGKMAVARRLEGGFGFGSTEFHVLRPRDGVDPHYVYHFVSSETFRKEAARHMTGAVGLRRVPAAFLEDAKIPLPDIDVQRRIVAEIEEQFSRLDEAVANLQRVKANLKRYKAAVLKAAVEGRLVETEASIAQREERNYESGEQLLERVLTSRRADWHKKTGYRESVTYSASAGDVLPQGWTWAAVEQLNPGNRPCAYGVLQPGDDLADGIPFVRVGDIVDGRIELAEMKRIHGDIAAAYPRTKLRGGEVLLTLVGAIGRTAVVPTALAGGNVARAVGVLPISPSVDAHWVEIWFRNPAKIVEMTEKSHEVARKTLNLEDVRLSAVALPPLTEQHRIVAEVDRRLSIVREVEAEVDANLRRAQVLRQSVLQKAFAGTNAVEKVQTKLEPVQVVLAARIIAANHKEATFGKTALMKAMFVATHHARLDAANDRYIRMQAGPLDMPMLERSVKRLNDLGWFREVKADRGTRADGRRSYEPLTKAEEYRQHLGVFSADQLKAIDDVAKLMRKWSTEQCELFATVYAAWNDLLLTGREPSAEAIIHELHECWHESKRRFSAAKIRAEIGKIRDSAYAPTGFGRPTAGTAADTQSGDLF